MDQKLTNIVQKLKQVRTYLIKIGPSRRTGPILEVKLREAISIKSEYNIFLEKLSNITGSIKSDEYTFILKTCEHFDKLYKEIISLCSEKSEIDQTMAKFDLKVALSLFPAPSDDESSVKQLIDSIEYYSSELDEDSKKRLVNFVLKNRLTQAGKLKLHSSYSTIDALVSDIKSKLLPKKSASAIQHKLFDFKQNNLSIDDFGKQISELFVDLTISQAGGDEHAFDVLRPLNEKQAIKCFADGLRNRRLSTVITARNYNTLKDAIQAAVDEDVTSSSSSANLMYFNRYNHYNNNSRSFGNRRGQRARPRGTSYAGAGRGAPKEQRGAHHGEQRGATRSWRGRQSTGRGARRPYFRGRSNNNYNQQPHIHTLTNTNSQNDSKSEENNQFFRD